MPTGRRPCHRCRSWRDPSLSSPRARAVAAVETAPAADSTNVHHRGNPCPCRTRAAPAEDRFVDATCPKDVTTMMSNRFLLRGGRHRGNASGERPAAVPVHPAKAPVTPRLDLLDGPRAGPPKRGLRRLA